MRTCTAVALLACLAFPLALAAQGTPGTQPPKLTPEQRAQAQSNLQAQSAQIFNAPLSAAKQELRNDVVPLRDTLQETDGDASRLMRASAARSVAVLFSTASVLRLECAGARKVADTTLGKIRQMNTRDVNGDHLLNNYRAAVTHTSHALAECERATTAELATKTPHEAALVAAADGVDKAIQEHDRALNSLMNGLEITMYPKGYVPPKAGH